MRQHEAGNAFSKFLDVARDSESLTVQVAGEPRPVRGAVLVCGATTPSGVESTKARQGFADVLSVELMVQDLHRWRPEAWTQDIAARRYWTEQLFAFLSGGDGGTRS